MGSPDPSEEKNRERKVERGKEPRAESSRSRRTLLPTPYSLLPGREAALPLGILIASACVALTIMVFGPSSSDEVTRQAATDCSGALESDYACYQERYQALVRDSGAKAAFEDLKDEYAKNEFVKSQCHQLTHVIGRAAAETYGDLPATYGQGDSFCWSGYYHGAMEAVVAQTGPDKILEEAGTLCAGPRENQNHSFYHYDCAHGLGHGFMGIQENELFESLEMCDALTDGWEKEPCYAGVFMQNMMAQDDPSHPSKYLEVDQPFYPCTDVEARYKNECYRIQTGHALLTQGNDLARVFDLCASVEDDPRPACYQGLGGYAAVQSIQQNVTDAARTESTNKLCMLGGNYEARSNCSIGAVKSFVYYYRSDAQARALCEALEADLRATCLETAEEYYKSSQT